MSESELKTITIDDVTYDADTLGEAGTTIVRNLAQLDEKLRIDQFAVMTTSLARAKLLDELAKETVNFTKV